MVVALAVALVGLPSRLHLPHAGGVRVVLFFFLLHPPWRDVPCRDVSVWQRGAPGVTVTSGCPSVSTGRRRRPRWPQRIGAAARHAVTRDGSARHGRCGVGPARAARGEGCRPARRCPPPPLVPHPPPPPAHGGPRRWPHRRWPPRVGGQAGRVCGGAAPATATGTGPRAVRRGWRSRRRWWRRRERGRRWWWRLRRPPGGVQAASRADGDGGGSGGGGGAVWDGGLCVWGRAAGGDGEEATPWGGGGTPRGNAWWASAAATAAAK